MKFNTCNANAFFASYYRRQNYSPGVDADGPCIVIKQLFSSYVVLLTTWRIFPTVYCFYLVNAMLVVVECGGWLLVPR